MQYRATREKKTASPHQRAGGKRITHDGKKSPQTPLNRRDRGPRGKSGGAAREEKGHGSGAVRLRLGGPVAAVEGRPALLVAGPAHGHDGQRLEVVAMVVVVGRPRAIGARLRSRPRQQSVTHGARHIGNGANAFFAVLVGALQAHGPTVAAAPLGHPPTPEASDVHHVTAP